MIERSAVGAPMPRKIGASATAALISRSPPAIARKIARNPIGPMSTPARPRPSGIAKNAIAVRIPCTRPRNATGTRSCMMVEASGLAGPTPKPSKKTAASNIGSDGVNANAAYMVAIGIR